MLVIQKHESYYRNANIFYHGGIAWFSSRAESLIFACNIQMYFHSNYLFISIGDSCEIRKSVKRSKQGFCLKTRRQEYQFEVAYFIYFFGFLL